MRCDISPTDGIARHDADKRITSTEDQITPADVSVSGGSDTEAGTRGQKDNETSRERTVAAAAAAASSVKKPTTFKSVPINKKFLTKTTTPSPTAKPADLIKSGTSTPPTGTSTLSASRPRLVAKTGTAGRDASPRLSSAVNGGKPGSAPDPAAVWNKNRRTWKFRNECGMCIGRMLMLSSCACARPKEVHR